MALLYPEQTNPRTLSPLTLAFVGDGVYELLVRERLACEGSRPAGDLHKRSVAMVRAEAQAAAVDRLLPMLTEEETAAALAELPDYLDDMDAVEKEAKAAMLKELIAGYAVEKRIRMDLTYDEIDNTIDNVWSVLFTTGYLIQEGREMDGIYRLIIPNKEVREVFVLQISEWFNRVVANDRASTEKINRGFLEGNVEDIQRELTHFLGESISVLDTKARNEEKEIFYHGILKNNANWAVRSNRESGDGYADILIKPKNPDTGIVIELKYARSFKELDQACERALEQIKDRRYDEALREDGRCEILAYGIAFWKKRCKVLAERL